MDGPLISIRKFAERAFNMDRLVDVGPAMVEVLAAAVQGKTSAIISGGTGSGKTTLLNALSHYIPPRERLLTIEDAAGAIGEAVDAPVAVTPRAVKHGVPRAV